MHMEVTETTTTTRLLQLVNNEVAAGTEVQAMMIVTVHNHPQVYHVCVGSYQHKT